MGLHIHAGKGIWDKDKKRGTPEPIPMYANIGVPHTECSKRDWYYGTQVGNIGDVRRCHHGKVQLVVKLYSHYGTESIFWETLNPVLDYFRYKKAVAVLDA